MTDFRSPRLRDCSFLVIVPSFKSERKPVTHPTKVVSAPLGATLYRLTYCPRVAVPAPGQSKGTGHRLYCWGLYLSPTAVYSACKHEAIPWKFGKQVSTTWQTDDKSVCKTANNRPQHIEKIEIVSKPQHGIAGKDGPFAVAYKPEEGLSDSFVYAVTSNSAYRKGAGLIARVTVLVIVQ